MTTEPWCHYFSGRWVRVRLDFRRSLVSGLRSSPKREFGGRSAGSFPEQVGVVSLLLGFISGYNFLMLFCGALLSGGLLLLKVNGILF